MRRARIRWAGGAGAVGAGGGFVAGLTVAGHLTWLGVGAVAGVAGVIVTATGVALQQSDRRYIRRREEADRAREETTRWRATEQERARVIADADAVIIIGQGGGGVLGNGFVRGDTVSFVLTNGSTLPISRIDVQLEPYVALRGPVSSRRPQALAPGAEQRWTERTEEYVIPEDEASGRELRTRAATATFASGGRSWFKRQGGSVELIEGDLPGHV